MKNEYPIAVVGATGVVAEALFEALEEFNFPVGDLFPLASANSTDKTIYFKNKAYAVADAAEFDFSRAAIAFFSAGGAVSERLAPLAAASGCVVIDNTSTFRLQDSIPLVVPQVNAAAIAQYRNANIIANPNCSTIQMLVALKPLYDLVGIERINVCTYQAVSGTGRAAISELAAQTALLLNGKPIDPPKVYPQQIAFNVLPFIDVVEDNGYSREEMKMVNETRKIFADETIQVNATAVRVPVFYGHSEAINIETKKKITAEQARECLRAAPGVEVLDNPQEAVYPTPLQQGSGKHQVSVGRIREDLSHERGLNLWVVADNVRKGAATNSIEIAQELIRNYL